MSLKNRKRKDPVAPFSEEISSSINDAKNTMAVQLVKYYASATKAVSARIISVDDSGFDVEYQNADNTATHDIRIAFDHPVAGPDEARAKLAKMAAEAQKILGVEVDKTYQAVGRKGPIAYHLPKAWIIIGYFTLWAIALPLRFLEDAALPEQIVNVRSFVGIHRIDKMFTALFVMHLVETIVALGLCLFARLPIYATLLWLPTVFVFGVPSLQNCLKVCIRHSMPRHPEFFGIPKGVLPNPDDEIKRARAAKAAAAAKNKSQ